MSERTRCPECNKVMRCNMYSHFYAVKWFECCGTQWKRGYTDEEFKRVYGGGVEHPFRIPPVVVRAKA